LAFLRMPKFGKCRKSNYDFCRILSISHYNQNALWSYDSDILTTLL
jgi:hypothetical protein